MKGITKIKFTTSTNRELYCEKLAWEFYKTTYPAQQVITPDANNYITQLRMSKNISDYDMIVH